jgi:hypothetical protein
LRGAIEDELLDGIPERTPQPADRIGVVRHYRLPWHRDQSFIEYYVENLPEG